jgi:hypothetical protein
MEHDGRSPAIGSYHPQPVPATVRGPGGHRPPDEDGDNHSMTLARGGRVMLINPEDFSPVDCPDSPEFDGWGGVFLYDNRDSAHPRFLSSFSTQQPLQPHRRVRLGPQHRGRQHRGRRRRPGVLVLVLRRHRVVAGRPGRGRDHARPVRPAGLPRDPRACSRPSRSSGASTPTAAATSSSPATSTAASGCSGRSAWAASDHVPLTLRGQAPRLPPESRRRGWRLSGAGCGLRSPRRLRCQPRPRAAPFQ